MADQPSKLSLSTLTTKQKVVGLVTVVIILFIIYEVIGMFSSGPSGMPPAMPAKAPASPKPMTAGAPNAPSAPMMGAAAPVMPSAPNPAVTSPALPTQVNTISASSHVDNEALKEQEGQQKAYLDSLNQLQLLKLKRDIAETNQAIASARLATETANKNMSDLLTQPALPQMPSVYGNKFATVPGQAVQAGQPQGVQVEGVPIPPPPVDTPFTVISVSMQYNHWNAVLSFQGKLYNVAIGDTLFDGSIVASISRNGVVLVKDGKRRKIMIVSTI